MCHQLQTDWDARNAGWNPDYDDPSTYLDTLQPASEDQTKVYLGLQVVDNHQQKL
ncbi:MAG: hypothetical protein ACLSFK_08625 [Streptococcus salivarius]